MGLQDHLNSGEQGQDGDQEIDVTIESQDQGEGAEDGDSQPGGEMDPDSMEEELSKAAEQLAEDLANKFEEVWLPIHVQCLLISTQSLAVLSFTEQLGADAKLSSRHPRELYATFQRTLSTVSRDIRWNAAYLLLQGVVPVWGDLCTQNLHAGDGTSGRQYRGRHGALWG